MQLDGFLATIILSEIDFHISEVCYSQHEQGCPALAVFWKCVCFERLPWPADAVFFSNQEKSFALRRSFYISVSSDISAASKTS